MYAALVIGGYVLLVVALLLWGRYAKHHGPLMDDDGNIVKPYNTTETDACTDRKT